MRIDRGLREAIVVLRREMKLDEAGMRMQLEGKGGRGHVLTATLYTAVSIAIPGIVA